MYYVALLMQYLRMIVLCEDGVISNVKIVLYNMKNLLEIIK